jgi:uncharacterized membrane protein YjjP (DUF1212 family)
MTNSRQEDMVPLSEEEQRLLEQMEEALQAEDPKFVSALRGSSARSRHKKLLVLGIAGFVAGIALLMAGAVLTITLVAVAGFVVMLGSAYIALTNGRQLSQSDSSDTVDPVSRPGSSSAAPRQTGFMSRMEDRWRRRRDDY